MKTGIFIVSLLASPALQAQTDIDSTVRQLWQAEDYAAAKALLAPKVSKKTKDARLLALLGNTEAALNNAETAEELLQRALKLDQSNADYQHWYATVSCNLASSASMFSAMGYAKRCKKAYQAALALAPENPRSYIALGRFYAQAPAIAGGDKDEALKLALQLRKIDELQGLLLQLSVSNIANETVFNALLAESELLRNRPEAYFQRAMALARDTQYAEAINLLQQALQQVPADEDANNTLTESRYQLARCAVLGKTSVAEGIAAMQQYLKENPASDRHDWAQLRLAQLYVLADEAAKAKAITQPLWASSRDDKLKAELKKLL